MTEIEIENWPHGFETKYGFKKGVTLIRLFGTEHKAQLEQENKRLKEEIERLSARLESFLPKLYDAIGIPYEEDF